MNDSTGGGPNVGRFVGAVFGFVFAGIGLTVIIFVWSQPFGGFGSPPLVFRIFASFIAIAFVAMGGGTAFAAITGKRPGGLVSGSIAGQMRELQDQLDAQAGADGSPPKVGYNCPNCGATLSEAADVSPHGDVKCTFCDRWFNIHK